MDTNFLSSLFNIPINKVEGWSLLERGKRHAVIKRCEEYTGREYRKLFNIHRLRNSY